MKWVALFPVFFWGRRPSSVVSCRRLVWLFFWYGYGDFCFKIWFSGSWNRIASCIAAGIFYAAGALVMLQGLAEWKWSFNRWTAFPGKKLMGSTVLFFLGILTESYLNPWNLRLLFCSCERKTQDLVRKILRKTISGGLE
ncbi:MAG: hypothetical protein ACLR6B_01245 [Blautia sp.]